MGRTYNSGSALRLTNYFAEAGSEGDAIYIFADMDHGGNLAAEEYLPEASRCRIDIASSSAASMVK